MQKPGWYAGGLVSHEVPPPWQQCLCLAPQAGTGRIPVKEVGMVMRALGMNPGEEELAGLVSQLDSTVALTQFENLVKDRINEVENIEELREAFSVFDRDGQGFISGAELRFMLTNLGEKLNDQEVDDMIKEAGIGSDGRFRYNDFIKKLQSGE